jgi:hypothetical protein
MKLRNTLVVLAAIGTVAAAHAQVSVLPFLASSGETFNAVPAGSYMNFPGFLGQGTFNRIGTGGLLLVTNNPALLPPVSGNAMFGRGVDVQIRFQGLRKRFGGLFRVATSGVPVTMMTVQFYNAGSPIGVPVTAPVNSTSWLWRGWDVGSLGGYDEVRIFGNGSLPGYVGMENLRRG